MYKAIAFEAYSSQPTVGSVSSVSAAQVGARMADPITVGVFTAWALGLAGEAIIKGSAGEAVKDAYQALKAKLSHWAAGDVGELEKAPSSKTRQAVLAEVVDGLSHEDQGSLHDLAQVLAGKLKEQAPTIGLDVGRLNAAEVQLGNITITEGIGARVQEANVPGTFRTGDISVGSMPGKR
jgi:hypothetical protein